jgi:hypothetical protein
MPIRNTSNTSKALRRFPATKATRTRRSEFAESAELSLQTDCHKTLTSAMRELKRLKFEYSDVEPFTLGDFPSQKAVRLAVTAFLDGSGSLMYVFGRNQAERLLNRIYHRNSAAAVGGQYDTEQVPAALTKKNWLYQPLSSSSMSS